MPGENGSANPKAESPVSSGTATETNDAIKYPLGSKIQKKIDSRSILQNDDSSSVAEKLNAVDYTEPEEQGSEAEMAAQIQKRVYAQGTQTQKEIVLAAGCFWGSEAYFKKVPGVLDTEVGYANGEGDHVTYYDIPYTGHAESVRITYDPSRVHLAELLLRFTRIINPLSVNRQGNDIGAQYRAAIFSADEESRKVAEATLAVLEKKLGKKPTVILEDLRNFIPAEEHHQDYLDKNPGGYCHINLSQAEEALFPEKALPSDDDLRKMLDEESYKVLRQKGTEPPHSGDYIVRSEPGLYVDKVSGKPLFSSDDQFAAGCGWPSFSMTVTTDATDYEDDDSHGMSRIEVDSRGNGNHLGHVFPDGPKDRGGLRYCINSVSLRFIPREQMEAEGYLELLPFVMKP